MEIWKTWGSFQAFFDLPFSYQKVHDDDEDNVLTMLFVKVLRMSVWYILMIRKNYTNAIKYCDEVPDIHVRIRDDKKQTYIDFSDNGIGIPQEYHKKVFGRFFRIPTGNIHNVKGFGLGLD